MTYRATKSEHDVLGAYPAPGGSAVAKEFGALDHHCVAFLALCPFVVDVDGDSDRPTRHLAARRRARLSPRA
jgi:hypothetical protein